MITELVIDTGEIIEIKLSQLMFVQSLEVIPNASDTTCIENALTIFKFSYALKLYLHQN